ncbi:MAG: hypothetical protein QOJ51_6270 [Acidobacteriaceae bacterium]|nr:hypothetical protein [Acidobacteriaceae bacterium]
MVWQGSAGNRCPYADLVGNPSVTRPNGQRRVRCGLPVTRPRSAASLQNSRFRNGAAGSDASQNGSYLGLVTWSSQNVRTRCRQVFVRQTSTTWTEPRGLACDNGVYRPYREQRLATTWEQLRRSCVRRDRGGQGELKSCAPPGSTGSPQAAAVRFNDRPADG